MTYKHREAFCLMKYATDDGTVVEWIWNSRDGVTPMFVSSKCGKRMHHVQWEFDVRITRYTPMPCERIFVDATEELLRPEAEKSVSRHHPQAGGEDRERLISDTIRQWMPEAGTPHLKEVGGTHAQPRSAFGEAIDKARKRFETSRGTLCQGDG